MKKLQFLGLTMLLALPLTGFSAGAPEVYYKSGDTLYVQAPSGLNLRAKADPAGTKILTIAYGQAVKVVSLTTSLLVSSGISGYWVQVEYKGKTGYIFDGFLSRLPAPDLAGKYYTVSYADHYLGKAGPVVKDKNGRDLQKYKFDVELFQESYEVGHTTFMRVKNIRLSEAFLLARNLAVSGDWWFTVKDEYPTQARTYQEVYKSEGQSFELQVESMIDKKGDKITGLSISKESEGYRRILGLEQGEGEVIISFTVVD